MHLSPQQPLCEVISRGLSIFVGKKLTQGQCILPDTKYPIHSKRLVCDCAFRLSKILSRRRGTPNPYNGPLFYRTLDTIRISTVKDRQIKTCFIVETYKVYETLSTEYSSNGERERVPAWSRSSWRTNLSCTRRSYPLSLQLINILPTTSYLHSYLDLLIYGNGC